MGRAGGGSRGGGGRSGGGSFSRSSMGGTRRSSGSFSRSSSGSRQSGNSFGRTSHGGSSFGGNSFGGGFGGGFGGFRGSPYGGASHRPRPIFINPGYGRKTVIINNSGNTTYTGTNTNTNTNTANGPGTYTDTTNSAGTATAQPAYTAPKELTMEQKIARAERLTKEARDSKKGSVKLFCIALILLVAGLLVAFGTKRDGFEKYELTGTVDAGFAYDDGFTYNGGRTEAACEEFFEKTGIPLYFYTVGEYEKDASTCDTYTAALYDTLFEDENHVLIAFYNNVDWWSWQYGAKVSNYMGDAEINDLIDEIYRYWDDTSLSNDAVLAKGITNYLEDLTSDEGGVSGLSVILCIAGLVVLVVAIYQFINYGSDAKKYEEEAKKLRADLILSQPLETFGNQEINDLKEKYK